MTPTQLLAWQTEWAAANLVLNFDLIPLDRRNWHPLPGGKSAVEIVEHLVAGLGRMQAVLRGGSYEEAGAPLEPTGKCLSTSALLYAGELRRLEPHRWMQPVVLPYGTYPLLQAAGFPVLDLLHHHGQIAYIQTLLGDSHDHWNLEALRWPRGGSSASAGSQ